MILAHHELILAVEAVAVATSSGFGLRLARTWWRLRRVRPAVAE